jgi:hypothetical protein
VGDAAGHAAEANAVESSSHFVVAVYILIMAVMLALVSFWLIFRRMRRL